MHSAMKTETKQNLWQIVKYLLTLGLSALVEAIKRRRALKSSSNTTFFPVKNEKKS